MSIKILIPFFTAITLGKSVSQFFTVYEHQGQLGTPFKLKHQVPDLTELEYADTFRNASSYCAVGWWVGYTNRNYNVDGGIGFLLDQKDDFPRCENRVFINFKSLRYLGNKDSDVPSISFYTKASYHGLEVAFNQTDSPSANLGFNPLSFVTTGWSNWTFHEGLDLTGKSWCVESKKKVTLVSDIDTTWPLFQSISSGCGF